VEETLLEGFLHQYLPSPSETLYRRIFSPPIRHMHMPYTTSGRGPLLFCLFLEPRRSVTGRRKPLGLVDGSGSSQWKPARGVVRWFETQQWLMVFATVCLPPDPRVASILEIFIYAGSPQYAGISQYGTIFSHHEAHALFTLPPR